MKNNKNCCLRAISKVIACVCLNCHLLSCYAEDGFDYETNGSELVRVELSSALMLGRGNPAHLQGTDLNNHIFEFTDRQGKQGRMVCYTRDTNHKSVYDLPTDRSHPDWTEYVLKAAEMLNSCAWYQQSGDGDINNIYNVNISINDGWSLNAKEKSGLWIGGLSGRPTPTHCVANVKDPIQFGTVSPSVEYSHQSIGSLVVECNKQSRIEINVNQGADLVSNDGSRITFSIWAPADVPGGVPTEIQIRGTLKRSPTKPGSYQWYVPILFSYE